MHADLQVRGISTSLNASLASGQGLGDLTGHMGWIAGVAVTSDGRRAVSASWDTTLKVWDLVDGTCRATFNADESLTACAATSDGHAIVAAGTSGRVHFLRWEE